MRKLTLVISVIAAVFSTSFLSSASASTGGEYEPSNVSAGLYVEQGQLVSESWRYAPTPEDDWSYTQCAPPECGAVVVVTKTKKVKVKKKFTIVKVKQVVLKKVAGETLVDASYSYRAADGRQGSYGEWDGKALPLSYKAKLPNGKLVTYVLDSAYASLYNPAWGLPPVYAGEPEALMRSASKR